jgi:hypothetical protein
MSREGRIEKRLWSIALPGFGQLLNGKFLKGLLLIGLEVLINVQSNFNKVPLSVTIDKDWRIVLTATVANKLRLLKLPQPILFPL